MFCRVRPFIYAHLKCSQFTKKNSFPTSRDALSAAQPTTTYTKLINIFIFSSFSLALPSHLITKSESWRGEEFT